jgi:hypothetical protein
MGAPLSIQADESTRVGGGRARGGTLSTGSFDPVIRSPGASSGAGINWTSLAALAIAGLLIVRIIRK